MTVRHTVKHKSSWIFLSDRISEEVLAHCGKAAIAFMRTKNNLTVLLRVILLFAISQNYIISKEHFNKDIETLHLNAI